LHEYPAYYKPAPQVDNTNLTRRQAALGALVGGLSLLQTAEANAFLGIGEPSKEEIYKEDTVSWTMFL
jgi:hypothetical protein